MTQACRARPSAGGSAAGGWLESGECPLSPAADKRPHRLCSVECQFRTHALQQRFHHSITSSAATCKVSGTLRPSALAVLKLITNSNLVGCIIGKLAGFSPLR